MINKVKIIIPKAIPLLLFAMTLFFILTLTGCGKANSGILNPKGVIAYQERQLLFDSIALMLIVVIPVIVMSFAFVFRYRSSHRTSEYRPNWCHNSFLEMIWWGVPCIIIIILGIMTWIMTHKLDPYQKINVPGKPLLVKVIALPWKWLFIYPQQNIATVNFLELPKGRQVEFWLTSDNVPMSAFFVPQLGSQIYTMAGMRTRLHLLATQEGTFEGLNSQYNGDGFSDMHFKVKVVQPSEMNRWYQSVKRSPKKLTQRQYLQLAKPTIAEPVRYYSWVTPGLFKQTIKAYQQSKHPRSFSTE